MRINGKIGRKGGGGLGGAEERKSYTRHCAMGVPAEKARKEIVKNGVQNIPARSSDRPKDRYHRERTLVYPQSIDSHSFNVYAACAFFHKCSILWTVLAIHLTGVLAISDKIGDIEVKIKVPKEAKIGSSIELGCEWQLFGGSGLYSVKWYKDEHEFFRYVPDDNPRIQTFFQPGIKIDNRWKEKKSIRLTDLDAKSSGQYKCEVSTEAPSFATTYRTANLTVIAMPEKGPKITGLSSHYAIGENVTANCTIWSSMPKAALRWLVNGKPITTDKTIHYSEKENFSSATAAANNTLGLRIELEPWYFHDARQQSTLAIKCIAQIGSSLLETEETVPMAYVNNERLSAGESRSEGQHGPCRLPTDRFSLHSLLSLLLLLSFTT